MGIFRALRLSEVSYRFGKFRVHSLQFRDFFGLFLILGFQFLDRFDQRTDEALVIHGHHSVLVVAYEIGKQFFHLLGDDSDLFSLGRLRILPIVGHSVQFRNPVQRTRQSDDVALEPLVGTREQGIAGVYVGAARPIEVEPVSRSRFQVEVRRGRSCYSSLRTDASVHFQFLRWGGISDSHVAVRENYDVRIPSRSVVREKIDFPGSSSDRIASDIDVSATVIRSVDRVRSVEQSVSAVVRAEVSGYERSSYGSGSEVFSDESVSHGGNVSVDAEFGIGGDAYSHVPARNREGRKISIEALQGRYHLVPFRRRQLARSGGRGGWIARNVGGVAYGKGAEGSEERGRPERRGFDFRNVHTGWGLVSMRFYASFFFPQENRPVGRFPILAHVSDY